MPGEHKLMERRVRDVQSRPGERQCDPHRDARYFEMIQHDHVRDQRWQPPTDFQKLRSKKSFNY